MAHPDSDPADVIARLEAAADRLKVASADPGPADRERSADELVAEALDGLSQAELKIRRARRRLAAIEAANGWDMRIRRA